MTIAANALPGCAIFTHEFRGGERVVRRIVDVEREADLIDIEPQRSLDIGYRQRDDFDCELHDCCAGYVHRTTPRLRSYVRRPDRPFGTGGPWKPTVTVFQTDVEPAQDSQIDDDVTNRL